MSNMAGAGLNQQEEYSFSEMADLPQMAPININRKDFSFNPMNELMIKNNLGVSGAPNSTNLIS